MSSILKKKKKKTPLGYTKKEYDACRAYSRLQMQKKDMTNNVKYTMRNIIFFLLHGKFDFGKVRLRNFQKELEKYQEEKIDILGLQEELIKKSNIDLQEHAVNIPVKEKCRLAGAVGIKAKEDIYLIACAVRRAYQEYMTMTLTVLKNRFKFSRKKLLELTEWVDDYINSFSLGYINDRDLIECLAEENGYRLQEGL